MGNSILVSKTTINVNRESYSTSSNSRLTATSSQQSITPLKQKETVSFRMSCVRSKLKSKGLSKTLSNISQTPGDPVQTKSMILFGISGSFGVIREKLIPCDHLVTRS